LKLRLKNPSSREQAPKPTEGHAQQEKQKKFDLGVDDGAKHLRGTSIAKTDTITKPFKLTIFKPK
jgi:hypothetical protein